MRRPRLGKLCHAAPYEAPRKRTSTSLENHLSRRRHQPCLALSCARGVRPGRVCLHPGTRLPFLPGLSGALALRR